MNICPKCGLIEELCVCGEIGKEEQILTIRTEKRKFGKIITIVSGFNKEVNIKEIAKELKQKLACGGTIKNQEIELQGEHKKKVKKTLIEMGFDQEKIKD
jgi:translation initiation factor 1